MAMKPSKLYPPIKKNKHPVTYSQERSDGMKTVERYESALGKNVHFVVEFSYQGKIYPGPGDRLAPGWEGKPVCQGVFKSRSEAEDEARRFKERYKDMALKTRKIKVLSANGMRDLVRDASVFVSFQESCT